MKRIFIFFAAVLAVATAAAQGGNPWRFTFGAEMGVSSYFNYPRLSLAGGNDRAYTAPTTALSLGLRDSSLELGLRYSLTDIRFDGRQVSFTVLEGSHLLPPEAEITRQDIFQDAAILQWSSSRESFSGNAWLRWKKDGDEDWQTLEVAPWGSGRYAHTFEELEPGTAYSVEMWFSDSEIGIDSPVNRQGSFRTKPFYSNAQPFIHLTGIERNDDGSFPAGTLLPLRCSNLQGVSAVRWTFNGRPVAPGADGYYRLTGGGTLRAVISYSNGQKEILQKTLRVK